jgi:phosphoglycerate dehydrogenase-like enzyme
MPEAPLVVVADPIDAGALAELTRGPCRVVDASAEPSQLAGQLPDAWGLIVRSRTKVTADLLGRAPHLALIARAGVGVDNIDMAAASARGIRVVNAPTAATTSVAELTVAFYLLLVRGLARRRAPARGSGAPSVTSSRARPSGSSATGGSPGRSPVGSRRSGRARSPSIRSYRHPWTLPRSSRSMRCSPARTS